MYYYNVCVSSMFIFGSWPGCGERRGEDPIIRCPEWDIKEFAEAMYYTRFDDAPVDSVIEIFPGRETPGPARLSFRHSFDAVRKDGNKAANNSVTASPPFCHESLVNWQTSRSLRKIIKALMRRYEPALSPLIAVFHTKWPPPSNLQRLFVLLRSKSP